ncbi:putative methionine aminopeptidase 1 [Diaporthe ampelina]|uniref:Methionine aminopeptidase n=1 Tax=Diaporthe ampelina TaxID=1214573 RepID=A0A0G2IC68_9PEZI|nr:putative methionine aminopeptidase 1 [Diaporthe ampelina]
MASQHYTPKAQLLIEPSYSIAQPFPGISLHRFMRENRLNRSKIDILDAKGQEAMRKVCRLARQVLDVTAAELKPGITTDYLDERVLLDGDILNLDISLYHGGYHADLNETYYIGEQAKANPDTVRVVETTRECLDKAIETVKPGTPIREFGNVIERHARSRGCNVVTIWGGHGINTEFHPPPWIPHYAKNKAVGVCKPGMTFTIEPILTLGKPREVYWPDGWTNVTVDGNWTAQFEHTMLVTETGVEVLTAGNANSPGGPVAMPVPTDGG